jgi:PKD repeat protein
VTALLTGAVVALAGAEARAAAPAAPCTADEFAGAALDGTRWSVLRPDGVAVAGGALRLPLRPGALAGPAATAANVVLQEAPLQGWTATTRLAVGDVDAPGERAGLVLWRAEGVLEHAFATVAFTRTAAGAARFETVVTDRSVLALPLARSGVDAPAEVPPDADVLLRLRSDGSRITAAYSADEGATWAAIGDPARLDGPVRVGLVAMGDGGSAVFDRFALSCGPRVEFGSAPDRGMATLEVGARVALADDRDDQHALELAWDFGDGSAGGGGQVRFHKYTTPGTYRPTVRATDSDGNTTSASGTVTVLASEAPCPAASDEFAGNGLDPHWRTLRPVPTGLDVHDGSLWLRPYASTAADARNAVVRPAPAGPWTLTTAVDVAALDAPGDRAGIALVRGEAVAHAGFHRTGDGAHELVGGDGAALPAPGPVPDRIHLRVASSGGPAATFTTSASIDGTAWTPVGGPFALGGPGQLQVGLVARGSSVSEAAGFDHARFAGPEPCGAPDTLAPETTHERSGPAEGPVRIVLAAVDDVIGSGVARTDYRVGDAAFQPYDGAITLAGPGEHRVAYRSVDRAGNVEADRALGVVIAPPPGPTDRGAPPVGLPAPRTTTDRPPVARPAARILAPAGKHLRARRLLRAGLRVRAACSGAASLRVRLRVAPRVARRLGLGRRTTLARRAARCDGKLALRLRPGRAVRRAVRRSDRRFAASLEVRTDGRRLDRRRLVFS